jgi:Ca2+-binding EF-hand superfamily protein
MISNAVEFSTQKKFTKEERDNEIATIFRMFDKNGDGKLMNEEISSFLTAIGREASKEEVKKIVDSIDADKNGYITIDEFITYMDDNYVISSDQIDELIDAFKIFDYDNSGSVSRKEFHDILTKFGPNEFSEEDIKDIFDMIDVDHDGTINYAEFIDMWKYQ